MLPVDSNTSFRSLELVNSTAVSFCRSHVFSDCVTSYVPVWGAFKALTLLVGRQEGLPACRN